MEENARILACKESRGAFVSGFINLQSGPMLRILFQGWKAAWESLTKKEKHMYKSFEPWANVEV